MTRNRRPVRNFIILPGLQWPYILRLLAMINLSGVVMATSICLLFYFKRLGSDPDGAADSGLLGVLEQADIMSVLVPAFLIADIVSLAIGIWIGLYFSRKMAVPIYRVRKWADAILADDLTYRLKFRPGDDLDGLEEACNEAADKYLGIIETLKKSQKQ